MDASKNKSESQVAIIYGTLPTVEEVDQLQLLNAKYPVTIITSESIVGYLIENSFFTDFKCIPLKDHNDNPTFLPGLDKILKDFAFVIVKERLGIYSYQVIKAKWKYRFRLLIWIDNLTVFPGEDIQQLRTIRDEVSSASDGFIVQTKIASNTLMLEGISKEKIFKWPNWISIHEKRDPEKKRKALEILQLNDRDIVIVFNGQIEWEEGLLELLHAIKLLKQKDRFFEHKLKLIICGIGSFANEIKQRSTRLGIGKDIYYVTPNRKTSLLLNQAADAIFVGGHQSRDRTDGDPYRLISAMIHGIPVIAPRTIMTEEILGKHRLDYCLGSANSIAKAIQNLINKKYLVNNIVEKNKKEADKLFNLERAQPCMIKTIDQLLKQEVEISISSIDQQVTEVESKIESQQYLLAIDLIENIFVSDLKIPDHHHSNLYRLIGDCFTKLGDHEAGKNAYVQAIELDKYSFKAYIGLGTVSLTRENFDIAIIHFQRAVSLAPNDEMANLGLGLSFHGLDELVEAQKWILKSLEINPNNTAAIFTIVKLSHEREVYKDAQIVLENYLNNHPHDLNMIYSLAGILYKQQKYQDVIDCLQGIVSSNPLDARAQSLIKQSRRALLKSVNTSVG